MDGNQIRAAIPRLRPDQRWIARHAARNKVVACGRRWGKTTLGMAMAIYHALELHERVWWVSPTYLLSLHPWEDFKRRLSGCWETKLEDSHHIALIGGGSVTVKTADNPDGLRGVGIDFLVVDEAAFMPDYVWYDCLRPALADRQGSALFISTPRGRNWFFHLWQLGQDGHNSEWQSWRYPTSDNPYIPDGEIAQARRELPERVFQQEIEAQFLEDGGAVFRNLKRAATAPTDAVPIPGHRYMMGIDFGRYEDFTACAIIDADSRCMVALDRFNEVEWGMQRVRIAALAKKWQVEAILAEANAMGEPNVESLWRDHRLPVYGFKTTALSKPPLVENLVAALENGDLLILPDPVLLGELEAYTYRTSLGGQTVYHAPEGLHDDTVIALALAWKQASVPRIALAIAEV